MNNLPELNQKDADNRALVGQCILFFLENDPFCKEIKGDLMKFLSNAGILDSFCKLYFKSEPETKNVVVWFMNKVFMDISSLKNANQGQFKNFLDLLSKQDLFWLENQYEINRQYNLNPKEMHNLQKYTKNITDPKDVYTFLHSLFACAHFHAEVIILSFYYKKWFNENYRYQSKNS